jgi:hypothetical protein
MPSSNEPTKKSETTSTTSSAAGVGTPRRAQPSPELRNALEVLKKIMPSVKAKPELKPKKTYPKNVN